MSKSQTNLFWAALTLCLNATARGRTKWQCFSSQQKWRTSLQR